MIAYSGFDVGTLKTREQAHAEFGFPHHTEVVQDKRVEHFRTRRKISNPLRGYGTSMGFVFTFGASEIITTPYELYLLGRRVLLGEQEIVIRYDSDGTIRYVRFEETGDFIFDSPTEFYYPSDDDEEAALPNRFPDQSEGTEDESVSINSVPEQVSGLGSGRSESFPPGLIRSPVE